MAKHIHKPDNTAPYGGIVSGVRMSLTHPLATSVIQKEQNRQNEINHIARDLKKAAIMISFLIVSELILFLFLTKHIVIIPTVSY